MSFLFGGAGKSQAEKDAVAENATLKVRLNPRLYCRFPKRGTAARPTARVVAP
jgi:hypothetical protein